MKRSEMILRMTEYWMGLFPNETAAEAGFDEEDYEQIRLSMDNLLKFLESKGMKPPIEDVCPVLMNTKGHKWEEEC